MLRLFRRKFLVAVVLTSCALASGAQPIQPSFRGSQEPGANAEFNPKNWKKFSSSVGRFSVLVPTLPNEEKKQLVTTVGIFNMPIFISRTNAEYGVAYADYPAPIEGTEGLVPFMDAVQDAGVKGLNGRLLDQHPTSFEGHPGRFYRVEFGGGYLMNARMLVVKDRLYLVTATTYGKKAPADVARYYERFARKFLESFRLT